MKISVGQIGSRMYYGVPQIINDAGYLHKFYTDFTLYRFPFSSLKHVLQADSQIMKKLNRRIPSIEKNKIEEFSPRQLLNYLNLSNEKDLIRKQELFLEIGKSLEENIIKTGLDSDAVFMVGTSSSSVFRAAKELGKTTIHEQISAPALVNYNIIKDEYGKYSRWEEDKTALNVLEFWHSVTLKDWENCDHIVCASEFVKEGIKSCGGPVERCHVIPYGVSFPAMAFQERKPIEKKLKVLTVGTVSLSKGTQYVYEAAKQLQQECEFKIAGSLQVSEYAVGELAKYVHILGHISKDQLLKEYAEADVFLLPSLSEGSATVGYEALNFGLPLVVTQNAGQFIQDGKEGFVVPVKSSEAIVEALLKLKKDPDLLATMRSNAKQLSSFGSYEAYKERIKIFLDLISKQ